MKIKTRVIILISVLLLIGFASFVSVSAQQATGGGTLPTGTPVYLPLIIYNPDWLTYLNSYRTMSGLPALTENESWSDGCVKHALYAVKNDDFQHNENPALPYYTPEGQNCAQSGNLTQSSIGTTDNEAIDSWMQAPFHAIGMLDPQLHQVGFGSYREAVGNVQMVAAINVLDGLGQLPDSVAYPVAWPGNGKTVALTKHTGEFPDPLSSCAGYSTPSGLPIILQIGSGDVTPVVTNHAFQQGNTTLESCIFDETNYVNSDSNAQTLGRAILDSRDAIILIPKAPLTAGSVYTVSITSNGSNYIWSFNVASSAQ